MILSTNQPYFAPFCGFLYKIALSDIFVILDDVQFPRGTTWVTRNRFKHHQGPLWITVPVWKKGLGLQRIDEVRICYERPWARKHLLSLQTAYLKSPYFDEHSRILEKAFSEEFERVLDLNLAIIHHLMAAFGLRSRIVLLSSLGISSQGTERIIEVCKRLGASQYLAQRPAKKYLHEAAFQDAGIEVTYFTPPTPVYPQLWGEFIANLSALDLLFNCGPKSFDILMAA